MENNDFGVNFESLLKQGLAVIDVRYRNYDLPGENYKFVIVKIEGDREEFYPNMLKQYTALEVKGKEIFDVWSKILFHKLEMSKLLDRDISIKVSAIDFFESKN